MAAGSEQEVADIGAALEVDHGTTPGDRQRLAMAESVDDAALRTGVERSLAPVVESAGVAAPKPTIAKQAKAKKERRAKRAAAKREATAVQLVSDKTLQSATPPMSPSEPPVEQPTAESVDELAATPSQYAMAVEESRELAARARRGRRLGAGGGRHRRCSRG